MKYLINHKPISFVKSYIKIQINVLLIFMFAWLIFYCLSSIERKLYIDSNWWFSILTFLGFILITSIQFLFTSMIYIYSVTFDEESGCVIIKWKHHKHFKEISSLLKNVEVDIKPSGKDNPYIEIQINSNEEKILLKQTIDDGWSKREMVNLKMQMDDLKKVYVGTY